MEPEHFLSTYLPPLPAGVISSARISCEVNEVTPCIAHMKPVVQCPMSSGQMVHSNYCSCVIHFACQCWLTHPLQAGRFLPPICSCLLDHSDILCMSMQADVSFHHIAGSGLPLEECYHLLAVSLFRLDWMVTGEH